ncbi:MAG: hypothetical protein U5K79_23045 [Cyclobacteriaceae bacterium]|nr:hypothetical protein [Cyclobacteriaceae bacterium]
MTDVQPEIIQALAVKDFGLMMPDATADSLEYLIDWLTKEIGYLIDRDFNTFLNMLYRIDVNEQKVKEAFAGTDPARQIAVLIIERERMKVESRKKYKF